MRTLSEIYDRFAETYDDNRGRFDMSEVFDAFYAGLRRDAGDVLDLGCGAGEPFARMFADRGWRVTGVDFSPRMLELAARYVPEMTSLQADIREVGFEPSSFDAVTAVYSLFHIPRGEHPLLFRRIHDWLRPGGKALFTYATREYTGRDEFDGGKQFLGEELYYSHKTPHALFDDLDAAGLDIVSRDYREIGGETFLWMTVGKAV